MMNLFDMTKKDLQDFFVLYRRCSAAFWKVRLSA